MENPLKVISFTGADEKTAIHSMVNLTSKYPQVEIEWALLYFPELEGRDRNPSKLKRNEILKTGVRCAAHLCGEEAFKKILKHDNEILKELSLYKRVQININAREHLFNDEAVISVYDILSQANIPLIFQYHNKSKFLIDNYLKYNGYGINTVLMDNSKGRGVMPKVWADPMGDFCGHAGGLNSANVKYANEAILKHYHNSDKTYWLDMETGVRENNIFSGKICEEVLKQLF